METGKLFIGPRLRALRLERGLTQTEFARLLGVSGSLVNLLERNQRSASLAVLMRLSDVFGLDLQDLTTQTGQVSLQQLRKTLADPAVGVDDISIDELRSAIDLSPKVVDGLMGLFENYQIMQERLAGTLETTEDRSKSLRASEQRVHEFFQRQGNYFDVLEQAAEAFRAEHSLSNHHALTQLATILKDRYKTDVKMVEFEVLMPSVRRFDDSASTLYLSDALDHGNKVFQLAHWIGLTVYADTVEAVVRRAEFTDQHDAARARVALCDYFAAALLMPYADFIASARKWSYDLERLSAAYGVSFEQVCQRVTTLQRPSDRGIPFFFLLATVTLPAAGERVVLGHEDRRPRFRSQPDKSFQRDLSQFVHGELQVLDGTRLQAALPGPQTAVFFASFVRCLLVLVLPLLHRFHDLHLSLLHEGADLLL